MPSAVSELLLAIVNRRSVSAWAGTLLVVACGGRATTPDDEGTTNVTVGDAGDGDSTTDTGDSATGGQDAAGTGGEPSDHEVDPDLVVGSCGLANACKCDSNRHCEEYLQPMTGEQAHYLCTAPPPAPAGVGGTWLDYSYDHWWDAVPCRRTRVIARCLWGNGTRVEYYYEGGPEENLLDGFERDCPGEFIRE